MAEDLSGSALSRFNASIVFEQLAYGNVFTVAFISIQNTAARMIDQFGSDALRKVYLSLLTSIKLIASYCLPEPGWGSDAAALAKTARSDGDDYVLSGCNSFISGAGTFKVYVVMARTGAPGPKGVSVFVVEQDTPGLSFGEQEKMGWDSQPTAQVNFDDASVSWGNRIGAEGDGFRFSMAGLDLERINIASCSLGGAAWRSTLQRRTSRPASSTAAH